MAKDALKSRLGDIAQGHFNLEKLRKPVPFSKLVEKYKEFGGGYKRGWETESISLKSLLHCSVTLHSRKSQRGKRKLKNAIVSPELKEAMGEFLMPNLEQNRNIFSEKRPRTRIVE